MVRLRRSDPESPGWTRRRAGRGFVYLDTEGARLPDDDVARVKELAIPPAWSDVWICPLPNGHIQAIGVDDAGRRQYLYHPQWRARRDRLKHDRVLDVARRLPRARERVRVDLARDGLPRERVLALAFALLDVAYLRIGGEVYARDNGSIGLSTLRRSHARVVRDPDGSAGLAGRPGAGANGSPDSVETAVVLRFPAKSGQRAETVVDDPDVVAVLVELLDRPGRGGRLLAWQSADGWRDLTGTEIGEYVRDAIGAEATPKDFRTWHATVLAATGLAAAGEPPRSKAARRRVVAGVVRDVADALGNTPAVCRASYIDPRVIDLWERGETIGRPRTLDTTERAVRRLLT